MARKQATRKRAAQPRKRATKKEVLRSEDERDGCPIVGIGGSAGGFEATMELLQTLPATNGMAFVIVQHLDPHHASRLASLLGRVTQMPVLELTGRVHPKPDTVYVQPPNKCVICKDGTLSLIKRTERMNVLLRLEGSNLFNHGNFLGRGQTVYGDTGTASPTFGQFVAVGTATNAIPAFANIDPPRMFQLQARFVF